mmetsp:Transcript_21413/g.59444  ORF Transcript_21413/g.59444 Transcript_21413/m.59444 type:complete len:371 (-) Transcript_21413:218-1330(-)
MEQESQETGVQRQEAELSAYARHPSCHLCKDGLALKVAIVKKGRGLVVVGRVFPPGEVLIQEVPETVTAQTDAEALAILSERIVEGGAGGRFAHLCTFSSYGSIGEDLGLPHGLAKAQEQVQANAFGARLPSGGVSLSLFSLVSFCNHSCAPNAALSRREGAGADGQYLRTLYTLQEIVPGEEIMICYDPALLWLPEPARGLRISETWRFRCACSVCEGERRQPHVDSLTDFDHYYDAKGRLTSGVVMRPSPAESDTGPTVVDIYEEAHEHLGASHWRTHVAREAAIRATLSTSPEEFDFDMLLEHLQETLQLMPPIHPHFLTWYIRLQQILASDEEAIRQDRSWDAEVNRFQALLASQPRVLLWNGVQN